MKYTFNLLQNQEMNLIFLIVLSALLGCTTLTKQAREQTKNELKYVKLSPRTEQFLNNLKNEKKLFNETDNFIPSEELIEKYSLIKSNDIYYVAGLIKVDEFSGDVDLPGVNINTKAGNIFTVQIPLNLFEQVIVNENLKYLQIDDKVKKR